MSVDVSCEKMQIAYCTQLQHLHIQQKTNPRLCAVKFHGRKCKFTNSKSICIFYYFIVLYFINDRNVYLIFDILRVTCVSCIIKVPNFVTTDAVLMHPDAPWCSRPSRTSHDRYASSIANLSTHESATLIELRLNRDRNKVSFDCGRPEKCAQKCH